MTAANIAHVQSLYAAFGRGDVATIIAGLTPGYSTGRRSGARPGIPTLGARKGAKAVQEFFKLVAEHEGSPTSRRANSTPPTTEVFVLGSYTLIPRRPATGLKRNRLLSSR